MSGYAVRCFALSPDQSRGLSTGGGRIKLWSAVDGRRLRELPTNDRSVWKLAWHSDGHRAVSAAHTSVGLNYDLRIWEVDKGRLICTLKGHQGHVTFLSWCPNGRHLLSGGGKTIYLWDGDTGESVAVLQGHADKVINIGWSADKRHLFSGDERGGIHVWDFSFLADD